jgi:hypothetical protein
MNIGDITLEKHGQKSFFEEDSNLLKYVFQEF